MALVNQCFPLPLPYEWVVSEPVEYAHVWYFTSAYSASQPWPADYQSQGYFMVRDTELRWSEGRDEELDLAGYRPIFTGAKGYLLVRDTGLLWSVGWGDELEKSLEHLALRYQCEQTAAAFLAQPWTIGALRKLCPQTSLPAVVALKHLLERVDLSPAQRLALLQAALVVDAGDVLTAQWDGFCGETRRILRESPFQRPTI